jgi:TatD DNase family protein
VLTDTHCHLDFESFAEDLPAVIDRARQAGLVRILNPGVDLPSSQAAIELAEKVPEIFAAIGLHPNETLKYDDGTIAELENLAQHPKVVAIGEIGLDYYRDWAPPDLQKRILGLQLDLAARLSLPVIIHNREASQELLPILAEWQEDLLRSGSRLASHPGVLHSFSGDQETALQGIDLGFSIGLTGPVTFKNAAQLQAVVARLPLENLLIETDAPFLAPHPRRGQRNEPAYVSLTAEKIADLHNQPFEVVAEKTTENAKRLFNW